LIRIFFASLPQLIILIIGVKGSCGLTWQQMLYTTYTLTNKE